MTIWREPRIDIHKITLVSLKISLGYIRTAAKLYIPVTPSAIIHQTFLCPGQTCPLISHTWYLGLAFSYINLIVSYTLPTPPDQPIQRSTGCAPA